MESNELLTKIKKSKILLVIGIFFTILAFICFLINIWILYDLLRLEEIEGPGVAISLTIMALISLGIVILSVISIISLVINLSIKLRKYQLANKILLITNFVFILCTVIFYLYLIFWYQ